MATITTSNLEGVLSLVFASLTAIRACYEASDSFSFHSLRVQHLGYRHSHLPTSQGYSDNDGDADPEALGKFSDRLPKTLALTFVAIDLVLVLIRILPFDAASLSLPQVLARVSNLNHVQHPYLYFILTFYISDVDRTTIGFNIWRFEPRKEI